MRADKSSALKSRGLLVLGWGSERLLGHVEVDLSLSGTVGLGVVCLAAGWYSLVSPSQGLCCVERSGSASV